MGMNVSMEQKRGKRMKLFELICAVSLSVVFTAGAMSSIKPGMELYARTVELERKVDRDSFMTRGFVNVCEENDREHWVMQPRNGRTCVFHCGRLISLSMSTTMNSIRRPGRRTALP